MRDPRHETRPDDPVLVLVPGVKRLRCLGEDEVWSNGDSSWNIDAAMSRVLRQFTVPTAISVVLRSLPREQCAAARGLVSRASQEGLLVLPGGEVTTIGVGGGLFGAPKVGWDDALRLAPDVVVFGVPYDVGTTYRPGARFGPESVRRASRAVFSHREGAEGAEGMFDPRSGQRVAERRLVDLGDVKRGVMTRNGDVFDDVKTLTSAIAGMGSVPLLLGGDHSLAYSSIGGLLENFAGLAVIHIDAHYDYSGMRIDDFRRELHHGNFLDWVVGDERVVQTLQLGVRQLVRTPPGNCGRVIQLPGKAPESDKFLECLPVGVPVYLTIDVDVLDPTVMPHTGTPVPRGWSAEELIQTVTRIGRARRIVGADVCEYSGASGDASALVVADLLVSILDVVGNG